MEPKGTFGFGADPKGTLGAPKGTLGAPKGTVKRPSKNPVTKS